MNITNDVGLWILDIYSYISLLWSILDNNSFDSLFNLPLVWMDSGWTHDVFFHSAIFFYFLRPLVTVQQNWLFVKIRSYHIECGQTLRVTDFWPVRTSERQAKTLQGSFNQWMSYRSNPLSSTMAVFELTYFFVSPDYFVRSVVYFQKTGSYG